MKIGIATRPLLANYGGILQNFALQHILRKLGHEPITIDFIPRYSMYKYTRSLCKTLLLWFIPWKRRPFMSHKSIVERNGKIENFCRKYISLTTRVHRYSPDVVNLYDMNAVITGSDQVWRAKYNLYPGHLEDMFLHFVQESKVKKLSYAASFGIDEWDYSKKETEQCKNCAKQFIGISVRESSGVSLCKQHLQVMAVTVLDPTLLLDRQDYEQICAEIPLNTSRFMAVYVLDSSLAKQNMIEKIAQKKGLKVKYFSAHHNMKLSIEEWLSMFRDAEFVVTDSFHGTAFSILFNKPFLSIGNSGRGMARFHSLLDMFNLQNRLCEVGKESIDIVEPIDWEKVNNIRKQWKKRSLDFLKILD